MPRPGGPEGHEEGPAVGVPGRGLDRRGVVRSTREFDEIQAMVMLQPVSANYIVEEFVKAVGMEDGYAKFDKAVHERTGFHLAEQSPLEHVKAVSVPTLVAQVHDDTMTRPQDVQDIYDAIRSTKNLLHWITGTDRRFDGYNYFGVHPVAVEWFDDAWDSSTKYWFAPLLSR